MSTIFKLPHICYEMFVYEKKISNFSYGVFVFGEKKNQIIIIIIIKNIFLFPTKLKLNYSPLLLMFILFKLPHICYEIFVYEKNSQLFLECLFMKKFFFQIIIINNISKRKGNIYVDESSCQWFLMTWQVKMTF